MNINRQFGRRILLTTSVVITVMLLPVTTFALDLEITSDIDRGTITLADKCLHISSEDSAVWFQNELVGFGDVDPANQQKQSFAKAGRTFEQRVSWTAAGFAETDPARPQPPGAMKFLLASNNSIQRQIAGFSEFDPATYSRQPTNEISSRKVVDCNGGNGMHAVLKRSELSYMTEKLVIRFWTS